MYLSKKIITDQEYQNIKNDPAYWIPTAYKINEHEWLIEYCLLTDEQQDYILGKGKLNGKQTNSNGKGRS